MREGVSARSQPLVSTSAVTSRALASPSTTARRVLGPRRLIPGLVSCHVVSETAVFTSVRGELLNSDSTSQDDDDNTALERLGETWRAEFQKRLKLREDADSMVEFDFAQAIEDVGAQNQDREDLQVKARPISDLAR